MRDELATVLRLVADGALSPEEAAPIIDALTRPPEGGGRAQPTAGGADQRSAEAASSAPDAARGGTGRQLRIRVTERGRQVINMRIPLAFADMALRMVPGITPERGDQIRQAIATHATGPIVDIEEPDGDAVLIIVE
jgi:hypothetical protein